jgi:hypothetical protein
MRTADDVRQELIDESEECMRLWLEVGRETAPSMGEKIVALQILALVLSTTVQALITSDEVLLRGRELANGNEKEKDGKG